MDPRSDFPAAAQQLSAVRPGSQAVQFDEAQHAAWLEAASQVQQDAAERVSSKAKLAQGHGWQARHYLGRWSIAGGRHSNGVTRIG